VDAGDRLLRNMLQPFFALRHPNEKPLANW
jgi:hypothetical protein